MFQSGCTTKVKGQAGIYPVACGSGRSLCRWQHLYAPSGVSLGSGLPATGIRVAIFHDTASTFLLLKLKLYFNWFVLTNFSLSQLVKAQRYEALTMTEQRWPWEFRGITSLFFYQNASLLCMNSLRNKCLLEGTTEQILLAEAQLAKCPYLLQLSVCGLTSYPSSYTSGLTNTDAIAEKFIRHNLPRECCAVRCRALFNLHGC